MFCIVLKPDEYVMVGEAKITNIRKSNCKIMIEAPKGIPFVRQKIIEKKKGAVASEANKELGRQEATGAATP